MLHGIELVFAARLKSPSHATRPPPPVPFKGGVHKSFNLNDITRIGKMRQHGSFVIYLLAEVDGILYALSGEGRTENEDKDLRKRSKKMGSVSGADFFNGFVLKMEDDQPAPTIRTLD